MKNLFKAVCLCLMFLGMPAYADDTASVETEALEISDRLRCLVCSDENIETAKDEIAQDMRLFIRRHLTDGKSQDLVVNMLLAQYGEMISLEDSPSPSAENEELFAIISTALCFLGMAFYIYRRSRHFNV